MFQPSQPGQRPFHWPMSSPHELQRYITLALPDEALPEQVEICQPFLCVSSTQYWASSETECFRKGVPHRRLQMS